MSQNALIARSLRPMSSLGQAWPIPLRLIVGYGFMEHGYAKLARGPESFANILHALNVPAPSFAAWATIFVELFGGFAVLVGAFIPLASVPMAIVLLVAIFTVHVPKLHVTEDDIQTELPFAALHGSRETPFGAAAIPSAISDVPSQAQRAR